MQDPSGYAADSPARPRVASLTKYIPYAGIPHAGGQYALQHYAALAERFDVDAYAPSTQDNRDAMNALPDSVARAELISGTGPFRHGRFKLAADIDSVLRGSALNRSVQNEFMTDDTWVGHIENAGVVEFQWSETASLAPFVRERLPRMKTVIVAHDLITQRWSRLATGRKNPATRLAYSAAAELSRKRERQSLGAVDLVVVFSEKDASIARDIQPAANVHVVRPGLGGPELDTAPHRAAAPVVLFTGAMNRPDNYEGVLWFLAEVWPTVRSRVPGARFVIAGAQPPKHLSDRVAALSDVELTGYVDSLEPYYADAAVFVSPIFTGAGVKFKTIDAMLRGVPIVSTAVGAEGVGSPDLYAGVHNDVPGFAAAVTAALLSPDEVAVDRAQQWASENFGFGQFRESLLELYSELLS
ncbi:glycosyltransferase [Agromyces atrinae]|uniref:Glycosyltransferase n=1 Tax=Agromyces atrinae TaxID=592376 RepID=A0A4Q2MA69_9MICO|nr:glycosyltransferase family 4 protein [Agromyces atrinae]NYD66679.1 glycosyltransferase involved in cell wall biosynthesis [Agromyces atrinae]RXZ87343.1 glycosyltransferase [Agromyces atrinae]